MDQESPHVMNELRWPKNIIPVCQPTHSSDLNPIDHVWEFIKQQLTREVFTTFEQLGNR